MFLLLILISFCLLFVKTKSDSDLIPSRRTISRNHSKLQPKCLGVFVTYVLEHSRSVFRRQGPRATPCLPPSRTPQSRRMTFQLMFTSIAAMLLSSVWVFAGCRSASSDTETGPNRTLANYLRVESSVPGVHIETNNVLAGKTPLTLRIFGDFAGTFHNFGSPEYIVRALPLTTNQFLQTRVFRTGLSSSSGDKIPGLLFFDMSQQGSGLIIDSIPDK